MSQQAYLAEMEEEGQFSVSQREQTGKATALLENQMDIKVVWLSKALLKSFTLI